FAEGTEKSGSFPESSSENLTRQGFYLFQRFLYRRQRQQDNRDRALCQQITVIVDNRIGESQCLGEVVRHVIHPVKISAQYMEDTPQENAQDIALYQS